MNLHYSKLLRVITFLVFASLYTLSFGQNKYYCDPTATGANDGSSWTDAYTTIQQCFDDEDLDAGDTVFLAATTFNEDEIRPTLTSDKDFVIKGKGIDSTIIQGGGSQEIFNYGGNDNIDMIDLKIKGGRSSNGAGVTLGYNSGNHKFENVYFEDCDATDYGGGVGGGGDRIYTLTFDNCTFIDCDAANNGGGISVTADSFMVISNCIFSNCTAGESGGGIYCSPEKGSITITTTTFKNCEAASNGGGCYVGGSPTIFKRSYFYGNKAAKGGGLYNAASTTLTNCLFYEDTATNQGGAIYAGASISLNYCSIADNICSPGPGDGDPSLGGVGIKFKTATANSCIFYNNTGYDFHDYLWEDWDVDNSMYESLSQESFGTIDVNSSYVLTVDPFINRVDDNYDIDPGSDAIDNGKIAGAPSVDITNGARSNPDIGAYEQGNGPISCIAPSLQASNAGNSALDSVSVTLTWTRGNGNQVLVIVRQDSSIVTDPTDGTTYSGNSVFASGDDLGSNSYAVYNSTGTSFTLTGLSYASTYYVEFFEQNTSGDCYNLTPLTYNFTTDSCYIYINDGVMDGGEKWCSAIGNDSNNGSDTLPYLTIQKAFDAHLCNSATVIRVDQGTYNSAAEENINPDDDDDDFTIIGKDSTVIIDPLGAYRAFYFEKNGNITLKNLKINGGNSITDFVRDGGAIYYDNMDNGTKSTFSLNNIVFSNNSSGNGSGEGGAVWIYASGTNDTVDVNISRCIFYNNSASGRGGALVLDSDGAEFLIEKCVFYSNSSSNNGSALATLAGNSTIKNSLFYRNNISSAGYGTVFLQGGTHNLYNLSIVNNTSAGGVGSYDAGLYSSATVSAYNCIVWDNDNDDLVESGFGNVLNFNNGCYASGETDGTVNIDGFSITSNPLFENAGADDYHLSSSSPAINLGTSSGAPTDDLDDSTRVGNPDAGCYEYFADVCAVDLTWLGGTSISWNENTNWSPSTVPCGNNVTIDPGSSFEPTLDTKGDCANLTINTGAILTWSSSDSLKVSGDLDMNGTAAVNHSGSGIFYLSGISKNVTVEASSNLSSLPLSIAGSYTFIDNMAFDSLGVKNGASVILTAAKTYDLGGNINNRGTLTMNNAVLSLEGNFTNTGTFTKGTSEIIFDGALKQLITGNNNIDFYNVKVNKVSALQDSLELQTSILTDSITISDGMIVSSWNNTLTVNHANHHTNKIKGGNDSSYIDGPVIIKDYEARGGSYLDALKVPSGNGGYYAPVWIMPSSDGPEDWTVKYVDTSARVLGVTICPGELIEKVSKQDYFHVRRNNAVNAKLRFYYNDNSDLSEPVIGDVVIAHWSGSCWDSTRADTNSNWYARDTINNYIETKFAINEFSPFTFASRHGNNLLPIELLSFNAHYEEDHEEVLIDWVTGSELNNDYFDIQRKKDGGKWSSIDRLEGAGYSNSNLYYSAVDANPLGGISHYRLKQVDFDGGYNYSSVSSVSTGFMASLAGFTVYANEVGILINLEDNKRSYYKLEVIAITGQIVHREMLNSNEGLNVYQIAKNLDRGMYQIVLSNQTEIYSKKLVIQH